MLSNFFKLDAPYTQFDEADLQSHLKVSRDLRSVLYRPDSWISDSKKIESSAFINVSFSKTRICELTFKECRFEDCLFIGSQFVDVEFHRCEFVNCNFYKATFKNCYLNPVSLTFDRRIRHLAANVGVGVYQQLYENSSNARQVDFARTADFEFRRWKRWQLRYEKTDGRIGRFDSFWKWSAREALHRFAGEAISL